VLATAAEGRGGARVQEDPILQIGDAMESVNGPRRLSESSALLLIDYAASQLTVQRSILQLMQQQQRSPTPATLRGAPLSLSLIDRALGVRVNDAAMLGEGVVT
jgi:hypothetical protein